MIIHQGMGYGVHSEPWCGAGKMQRISGRARLTAQRPGWVITCENCRARVLAAERAAAELPYAGDWIWRWQLDIANPSHLHRIVVVGAHYDDTGRPGSVPSGPRAGGLGIDGAAACGVEGSFMLPGLVDRMHGRRCPACCDKTSLFHGRAAPFNLGVDA